MKMISSWQQKLMLYSTKYDLVLHDTKSRHIKRNEIQLLRYHGEFQSSYGIKLSDNNSSSRQTIYTSIVSKHRHRLTLFR